MRLWAVNKISDTVGNYLTLTYCEDDAQGSANAAGAGCTGAAQYQRYLQNPLELITPVIAVQG